MNPANVQNLDKYINLINEMPDLIQPKNGVTMIFTIIPEIMRKIHGVSMDVLSK